MLKADIESVSLWTENTESSRWLNFKDFVTPHPKYSDFHILLSWLPAGADFCETHGDC